MKLNKIILGAAALAMAGGIASAQSVTFHAGVDFTTYALTQSFQNTNGTKSNSAPSAGYDPDGNIKVDVNVAAANFAFNLGLYFNADGGDEEYYDFSDQIRTPFYQGNMKVGFWNDQINVYAGKFDGFNAGYIADGYVLGGQSITNLADADFGQYLMGLEFGPYAVPGLKMLVGFPILPVFGNGINDEAYNRWSNLYKKVKFAASYELPIEALPIKLNAGIRPGTFYDGVEAADATGGVAEYTEGFTKSAFGEGFLQAEIPGLAGFIDLNASYDIRWTKASYVNSMAETVEHVALAHMIGASAKIALGETMSVSVEDRFYAAGDDYIHSDEKVIYDVLGADFNMTIPGTTFTAGVGVAGIFAADADGTAFADAASGASVNSNYNFAGVAMSRNDMATASVSGLNGAPTTYIGFYANPYFAFNFENGAVTLGAELNYTKFFNENASNDGFSYRIPVGVKFNF